MPALAQQYTVITPDLRGLGDSSKPESGYDPTTVAEDIYQLSSHLGFQEVNLVGHDIAGAVVYAYAARYPDAVHRLVVLESSVPGFDAPDAMVRTSRIWHMAFHQEPNLPEALITGRERPYLQYFFTKYAYDKMLLTRRISTSVFATMRLQEHYELPSLIIVLFHKRSNKPNNMPKQNYKCPY